MRAAVKDKPSYHMNGSFVNYSDMNLVSTGVDEEMRTPRRGEGRRIATPVNLVMVVSRDYF